jgi:phosphoribosylformylglycinamidine synthase
VLTGFGINGELEMAQSFEQNGLDAKCTHLEDLISGEVDLKNFQILAFPGGFAYGDDLGAGVALANRIKNNIGDKLMNFVSDDKLVFGICNGFQMMVNLGLLPGFEGEFGARKIALKHNESNRYQCRFVWVKNFSTKCIWTKGVNMVRLSVGHGEGNFFTDEKTLADLNSGDQVVFRYTDEEGNLAKGKFPTNPNGAMEDIAGVCDASGRVFGLMPHPDRLLSKYNEDLWTLEKEILKRRGEVLNPVPLAQKIYENAAAYFA